MLSLNRSVRALPGGVEEELDALLRGTHQHAVSEVEDVPRGTGFRHDVLHRLFNRLGRREEHRRVDVPLHRLVSHPPATVLHVDGPVQPDAVHAGGGHALEEAAGAVGVESQRHARVRRANLVNHLLDVRLRPLLPHVRGELTAPGVEDLHALRARVDLVPDVVAHRIRDFAQDGPENLGLRHGHGLDRLVRGGAPALDDVGGEGPGRADEAEHRGFVAHLLAESRERLADEGEHVEVELVHHLEPLRVADGLVQNRSFVVVNLERDPNRGEGGENVGEENHAVGLERVEGLEGDLDDQVGVLRALAETGNLHRQVAIFLHVAASLAHHPGGGAIHGEALRGAHEPGLLRVC